MRSPTSRSPPACSTSSPTAAASCVWTRRASRARTCMSRPRRSAAARIETVNGAPAEPVEERPWFGDLTPVFPSHKLKAPKSLKDAPIGRGSRVAIAGPPGAGATWLLRELAGELSGDSELGVQVVLAGVRPEEVTEWHRVDGLQVAGGSFDRSPDAQAQAAELAVERAKRRVERGGHAVVLIDSLEALPAGGPRRAWSWSRAGRSRPTAARSARTRCPNAVCSAAVRHPAPRRLG